jgi:hypothetical protein
MKFKIKLESGSTTNNLDVSVLTVYVHEVALGPLALPAELSYWMSSFAILLYELRFSVEGATPTQGPDSFAQYTLDSGHPVICSWNRYGAISLLED